MWVLKKIHEKLERYCSATVGAVMIHRQKTGKWPEPDPTTSWRFKLVSRLEFRLRCVYGRQSTYVEPMRLPQYLDYSM